MTAKIENWRLFIAIELPDQVRRRLFEHSNRLRTMVPGARASWVRKENLHLTLKFLGDVPSARIESIAQAVRAAAETSHSFELILGACGAFPPKGQPKVLWIGVEDPSGELGRLYQAVEQNCEKAGLAREHRPFRPHLTIARVRESRNSRQLSIVNQATGFGSENVMVRDLALIRSELQPDGSRHTVIAKHALGSELLSGTGSL